MKKFALTMVLECVSVLISVVIAKLMNKPVDSVIACVALGLCCGMYADDILHD